MNFYQYQSYTEVKDEAIKDTEWKKKIIVFLYKNKLSFIQISYTVAITVPLSVFLQLYVKYVFLTAEQCCF